MDSAPGALCKAAAPGCPAAGWGKGSAAPAACPSAPSRGSWGAGAGPRGGTRLASSRLTGLARSQEKRWAVLPGELGLPWSAYPHGCWNSWGEISGDCASRFTLGTWRDLAQWAVDIVAGTEGRACKEAVHLGTIGFLYGSGCPGLSAAELFVFLKGR